MIAYGNYELLLGIPWSPNLNRPAEARVYGAKCVARAHAEVRDDPNDATAKLDLGMSLRRLGMLDPEPNKTAESLATLREARGLIETITKALRRQKARWPSFRNTKTIAWRTWAASPKPSSATGNPSPRITPTSISPAPRS
jgi:hypothetical protein